MNDQYYSVNERRKMEAIKREVGEVGLFHNSDAYDSEIRVEVRQSKRFGEKNLYISGPCIVSTETLKQIVQWSEKNNIEHTWMYLISAPDNSADFHRYDRCMHALKKAYPNHLFESARVYGVCGIRMQLIANGRSICELIYDQTFLECRGFVKCFLQNS